MDAIFTALGTVFLSVGTTILGWSLGVGAVRLVRRWRS